MNTDENQKNDTRPVTANRNSTIAAMIAAEAAAENSLQAPGVIELTPAQRSELRAAAHGLNPVVSISQKGLTAAVLAEIERCLKAHELIKIRVFEAEREARETLLAEICNTLGAAPVQHIGKLLVIWREKPESTSQPAAPARPRRNPPRLTKKAAAAKADQTGKAAPTRPLAKGKPGKTPRMR